MEQLVPSSQGRVLPQGTLMGTYRHSWYAHITDGNTEA